MLVCAPLLVATLYLTGAAHAQSTPPASGAPQFITIGNNAILSSRLIGLNVQTGSGEGMGKIEDIVFEGGEIMGIVLSVGDVLGSGPRYVAVDPSAVSIRYVETDHKWQAVMNGNRAQLRNSATKASGSDHLSQRASWPTDSFRRAGFVQCSSSSSFGFAKQTVHMPSWIAWNMTRSSWTMPRSGHNRSLTH
ncbi:hypothetical protein GR328_12150 [Microvirga makkahensis]|uniref:PRC-barrel domain-containing protein n=1 Tax=Microvirga makkahensis TaxID=1128670 RepID=A0A7X3MS28_9HYPH|nr:hypothetical protein [Microvirga makkahensis]